MLEQRGKITKVDESAYLFSQIVAVKKTDGSLCICIDPRSLNKALIIERQPLPILPKLERATRFSKVDRESAFWQVELDKQANLLTTFGKPKGPWQRLPFAIKVYGAISQKRLQQILENPEGVYPAIKGRHCQSS